MKSTTLNKSQKRLFVVLALVASYAVYDLATGKPKQVKSAVENTSSSETTKPEQASLTGASGQTSIPVNFPISEWRRDPFRKQKEITSQNLNKAIESLLVSKPGNLHLTAISKKGNKSYALINEQILTEGEALNGYRVVAIQANQVILRKNDFSFTLTLPEDE